MVFHVLNKCMPINYSEKNYHDTAQTIIIYTSNIDYDNPDAPQTQTIITHKLL